MTLESPLRILVVDDFDEWRVRLRSLLQKRLDWQVVGEACDGLEAVQMTTELRPEVVLMDVGMPILNGIEAATQIRQTAPDARIIFVTQNGDKDLVREALSTGAQGFILKTDAERELLTAVAGVLGGDDFVSSGIHWDNLGETEDK